MMIIHPVAGDGWLLVATITGLQTHAGFNSPLSFQIGSNVHNVHTEQSPVSWSPHSSLLSSLYGNLEQPRQREVQSVKCHKPK